MGSELELRTAKRLAARALGHDLAGRDRRAIVAATSIRAVRRATAQAAARTRWCESRPSRGALTDMARLLGARRGLSCEELLHTAAEGAQSGEDPKKFLEASRVVGRVLERANPAKDLAFAKLSKHLRRDLGKAYKSLGRSLERLLRERHQDDKDLAEEAKAFVRCVAKARPGHFEESCCGLLPSFSHCRAKLGTIDRLSLEVERELPVLGAALGRKVALFGAAMLGAALLVGGAAYSGWLPVAKVWAASGIGAAQDHAQWAWDKLSALPRWAMGGDAGAAHEAARQRALERVGKAQAAAVAHPTIFAGPGGVGHWKLLSNPEARELVALAPAAGKEASQAWSESLLQKAQALWASQVSPSLHQASEQIGPALESVGSATGAHLSAVGKSALGMFGTLFAIMKGGPEGAATIDSSYSTLPIHHATNLTMGRL
jgi:hypothetical protein